jgi:rod shape-determining protein MreD
MKYIFHTIFIFVFSIIQATLFNYLSILGVKPNLFLIYVVLISCIASQKEGAILGFVSGLVLDILVGKIIGLNAILMMLVSVLISNFCINFIRNLNIVVVLTIVVVITLIYELFYYIIAFLGDLHLGTIFIKILLPECLYSVIATIPIYLLINKFSKRLWTDKGEGIG